MALARLDWTREEIILAMDLYVRVGAFGDGPIPGNSSAQIVQLSDLLKAVPTLPNSRARSTATLTGSTSS